ncbi:hypothetical protein BWQ96_07395 [Gracilariopsis chorda]|uniref:Uncharacterized protein n=1 Tax=Gracilariopsis chorda TaxID=448386 RepID=A0A2V3IHW8_9FLOR|nr:hypothetical protein BWQ96_08612 [Gracilariopsis chorda]PXF42887.1 hypothetical protein BWQ96_07395 [Gracilariopsis chorda]|eukprot:PXF41661.1 hypothetical protein BWQ96_08612 [Gracilariopsis chorda]
MSYEYSYYSRCGAFNRSPTITDEREYDPDDLLSIGWEVDAQEVQELFEMMKVLESEEDGSGCASLVDGVEEWFMLEDSSSSVEDLCWAKPGSLSRATKRRGSIQSLDQPPTKRRRCDNPSSGGDRSHLHRRSTVKRRALTDLSNRPVKRFRSSKVCRGMEGTLHQRTPKLGAVGPTDRGEIVRWTNVRRVEQPGKRRRIH